MEKKYATGYKRYSLTEFKPLIRWGHLTAISKNYNISNRAIQLSVARNWCTCNIYDAFMRFYSGQVMIGNNSYIYKKTENKYTLTYDHNDKEWYENIRGKIAFEIEDTGNGLIISQEKPNELNYSEVAELKYLLSKIEI